MTLASFFHDASKNEAVFDFFTFEKGKGTNKNFNILFACYEITLFNFIASG
jgi:hypothetical protein